ncbi:MAG: hypothetical protein QW701_05645 [Candidatus Nezhaarchaeales archaeon]
MRPGTKVYVARIAFAILAGLLSALINPLYLTFQSHGVAASVLPIIIAIFLYVASYYFVKKVIKLQQSGFNEPSYIYRGGLFTYIFMWIVTWSLVASLLHPFLIQ